MRILNNEAEMQRLLDHHNDVVKDKYQCDMSGFYNLIYSEGYEDLEADECYVEISSHQTKSGHAEILDW